MIQIILEFKDHWHHFGKYRSAKHSLCNLKYSIPKEIPLVFHNGSNYDYHFIIKVLTKGFDRVFNCLWENTEKYNTFSIAMGKKLKGLVRMGKKLQKFIDHARFIASSLSYLLIILLKKFIKSNVNMDIVIKHVKLVDLNTKNVKVWRWLNRVQTFALQ